MKTHLFPILFIFTISLFISNIIVGQSTTDSLKKIYENSTVDTIKYFALLDLAKATGFENVDTGMFYQNKSILLSQKMGRKDLEAKSNYGLGQLFLLKKDYLSALLYINSAKDYFESINSPKVLRIEQSLILIALENSDSNYINKNFITNVAKAKEFKDTFSLYYFYYYHAKVLPTVSKAEKDSVEKYLQLAYQLTIDLKDKNGINQILSDLVDFLFKNKRYTNINTLIKDIDKTILYFKETNNNWNLRYSLHIKGLMMISANLNKKEIPVMLASIETCNKGLDDNDGKLVYWELKYKYDSAIGNIKDAFKSFREFHNYDKTFAAEVNSKEIRNLSSAYQLKNVESEKNILAKNLVLQNKKNIYQRTVFLLVLLALIAFVASTFIIRKNKQVKKQLQIEKFVTESELKALRSQLNPHFIQNTFDFIATGIRKNDVETNVKNIKSLSNYMRQVLYKTDKSVHSLEDEIIFIEEYLKTQQMLLPNVFKYTIDIDDAVDTIGIQVPSMLLQPIVENSIKHGFKGLDNGGLVTIKITMQQNCLNIVIGDNGKGITEISKEIDYESTGIANTLKKLELLYSNATIKPTINSYNTNNDFKYCINIKIYL